MPSHQQFLWEHALLLVRSYEWKAAADLFSLLSTCIESTKDRQRCCVNEGLLHARMGNMNLARDALHKAFDLDVPSIILRCALAEVEAKMGNFRPARFWYDSCLILYTGHSRADETYYFGYCPTKEVLEANLKALATSTAIKHDFANSAIGFERIPADCIFFPSPACGNARDSALSMLSVVGSSLNLPTTETYLQTQNVSKTNVDRRTDSGLSTVLEDDEQSHQHAQGRSKANTAAKQPDQSSSASAARPARPRPKLQARDARTRSESLKELAEFLRNASPAGKQQYLVDHTYMMGLLDKAGVGLKHEQPPEQLSDYRELMDDIVE